MCIRDSPDKIWFYGNPNGKANIWMRPYKGAAEEPDQELSLIHILRSRVMPPKL